jgi:OmcA/MtrC family decaheme c-type cytochrome
MSFMRVDPRSLAGIAALLAALLVAGCGGGGGSGSAAATSTAGTGSGAASAGSGAGSGGANPGPQNVPYADAEELVPFIRSVTIPADGRPDVEFQLADGNGVAITDLSANDIRLTVAKAGFTPVGNLTAQWQSYIDQIEMPNVGIGTEPRLQATNETGTAGTFTNNADGTYQYRFAASVTDIDPVILAQAALEGLDLSYQPTQVHRVAMEFRNARVPSNASHDWIPDTGETESDGVFTYDIVATANCNGCHGQLALHGGSRIEVRYCVTCHNPGSTDADSTNTVAFKNMIHKIHRGEDLPSVRAGTPYVIYGFNDQAHDYSNLVYPGDIRECVVCHAGNSTATSATLVTTNAGDNWSEIATRKACGSCHDDLDFGLHFGGQPDDTNCMSCHQTSGVAGSIAERHENRVRDAGAAFEGNVLSVTNSAPGEQPVIRFSITDPTNGDAPYDILSDFAWTQAESRLAVTVGWSTTDYTNTGNQGDNASNVSIDALVTSVDLGDGTFEVTSPVAVPDGSLPPNIPATGSGAVVIEGHAAADFGTASVPDVQAVPFPMAFGYFSIDESDGNPVARRTVVSQDNCLGCHGQLVLHGANRTDTIEGCVTCHNPRNTDKSTRDVAVNPPTDGKDEESLDFKTMIHGIHAARLRQNPLQIVGFGGFSTHVYDTDTVQYPQSTQNCVACHAPGTFGIPLAAGVLAPTNDTAADVSDPTDDRVTSTVSSVCASCHDGATAQAHMEANGGNFDTTQADIDSGAVLEQCEICHGSGRVEDVAIVHELN